MSARLIIATHVLNGRRVGRIANLKTLDDVATIKEAVEVYPPVPEGSRQDYGRWLGKKALAKLFPSHGGDCRGF